jgi:hypothetical protein
VGLEPQEPSLEGGERVEVAGSENQRFAVFLEGWNADNALLTKYRSGPSEVPAAL